MLVNCEDIDRTGIHALPTAGRTLSLIVNDRYEKSQL